MSFFCLFFICIIYIVKPFIYLFNRLAKEDDQTMGFPDVTDRQKRDSSDHKRNTNKMKREYTKVVPREATEEVDDEENNSHRANYGNSFTVEKQHAYCWHDNLLNGRMRPPEEEDLDPLEKLFD